MVEKFLWRFYWSMRRGGSVEGLFVATEIEVNDLIGRDVYFGEILGKHSEVYGTIGEDDISKFDLDSETVSKVEFVLGETWSGYNPFHYIRYTCEVCEDKFSHEEMYSDKVCWGCHDDGL